MESGNYIKVNSNSSFWPAFQEAMKIAMESVWQHKLRSFLTLIGIIIGVSSVMIVGAFISGMDTYVTENVTSLLGSDTFMVSKILSLNMTREEFLKKLRTNRPIRLDEYKVVAQKATLASSVEATVGRNTSAYYKDREVYETSLSGTTPGFFVISDLELSSGRFFKPFENEHNRNVSVIGWAIRNELFHGIDPIGKMVKIDGIKYKVLGVLKKRGSFLGNNLDNEIYIPLYTYLKKYGKLSELTIHVKSISHTEFENCKDEVRVILRNKRHLRPGQKDTFDFLSTEEINKSVGQFTSTIATVVTPITLIALIVGGIVIMNIMLVSVTERTKEIGIRKAVGAKKFHLLLQFLIEASILGGVGGIFGVIVSYLTCIIITSSTDFTLTITVGYIMLSVLVSGGIGIIAGMYPAYKAARLDPIIALTKD